MQDGSKKAIFAAFGANLGIAVAKFIGFLITRSAGLLAESVHSLADTGNQGLLLLGSKRSSRESTRDHQFGYARERYFWSFVVALVLFSLGGMFALYEGIQKLANPHEIDNFWIAIGILCFAVALESYSLRTAVKEANRTRPKGMSWWKFIRNSRSPELPVVLLEDTGAEVGLLLALFGIVMARVTGDARWDALGSIAIGVLLVVIAIVLAIETKALLIGESVTEEEDELMRSAIVGTPLVMSLIHLRTQHLGPEDVLVAAKIEFDHSLSVIQLADAIDDVERHVRAVVPAARLIFLEPDIHRL